MIPHSEDRRVTRQGKSAVITSRTTIDKDRATASYWVLTGMILNDILSRPTLAILAFDRVNSAVLDQTSRGSFRIALG